MYIGRIVAVAMNNNSQPCALYRVSSRSFPNRQAVVKGDAVAILPRVGAEGDLAKNPYIAYNCLRQAGDFMVVSNGSQTDPIMEKLAMGYPARDAISLGLLALDYEKDALDTPRIVGVVKKGSAEAFLGIIRKDALLVRKFDLTPGKLFYISTYEKNAPCRNNTDDAFTALTAADAARFAVNGGVFAQFTNPVTAAAAVATDKGYELGTFVVA